MPALADSPLLPDELELLASLVPLADVQLIELGCGAADLGRKLLQRHPGAQLTGLEVDERQQAKNLAAPQERLTFVTAGAQAIPSPDASFEGALMLKSLHHASSAGTRVGIGIAPPSPSPSQTTLCATLQRRGAHRISPRPQANCPAWVSALPDGAGLGAGGVGAA